VQKSSHDGFARDTDIPNYRLDDANDYSGNGGLVVSRRQFQRNGRRTGSTTPIKMARNRKAFATPIPILASFRRTIPVDFDWMPQLYYANLKWGLPWGTAKSTTSLHI